MHSDMRHGLRNPFPNADCMPAKDWEGGGGGGGDGMGSGSGAWAGVLALRRMGEMFICSLTHALTHFLVHSLPLSLTR